jgi:hypothetical protein
MRKRSCVLLAVCRTVTAKYFRHFEVWTFHRSEGSEILYHRCAVFCGRR